MRDDHIRRYARHILLPDLGGLGQTALLGATARVDLGDDLGDDLGGDSEAALLCATYLAAGGTGALVVPGATPAQLAELAEHGPDTRLIADGDSDRAGAAPTLAAPVVVAIAPRPAWWPGAAGDTTALACWRGGLAAVRAMADIACR